MVGVPRSSGCRICVQRRVKCDGARPTCNNCRKGNRPCPGYGPGVKFQDEGPKLREKYQKEQKSHTKHEDIDDVSLFWALAKKSSASSTQTWDSPSGDDDTNYQTTIDLFGLLGANGHPYFNLGNFLKKTANYETADLVDSIPFFDVVADPLKMLTMPVRSPQTHQLQLLANFSASITQPGSQFLPPGMRMQGAWLSQLPDLSGASKLLDAAIRSVTLIHFGILNHNEQFMIESRPFYGSALRLLNKAIADEEMLFDNKTLCATILLSFYEMFASDKNSSWVRHAGGAAALMKIRGPERHRTGLDRDIFIAYRHTLVVEAMTRDEPSFLNEPEWRQLSKEIYQELIGTNQIPENRREVFDIAEKFYSQMASISVTTSQAWHLKVTMDITGKQNNDEIQKIYLELLSHRIALQKLMKRWEANLKKIGHYPPLKTVDDPIMPFQYQFSNVFVASFCVGFWTTIMLVHIRLIPLALALGLSTAEFESDNEECAMETCRSVDFMLTSSFLGPFFTIFGLRFSYRVFSHGDIRGDWTLCKLVEIGDRRMQFAKAGINGDEADRPIDYFQEAKRRVIDYRKKFEEAQKGDASLPAR